MSDYNTEARAVYVISVAAELAGMHAQTLRLYERRGLVNPARTGGGSRRYSAIDISRLQRIQDLTNAGLNLEGVRRVIELEEHLAALQAENARLQQQLASQPPSHALMPLSQVHIRTWSSGK